MGNAEPTLEFENALLDAGWVSLASLDEVGRGALSGPVVLGAVLITRATPPPPAGIRDSKLLTAKKRHQLIPQIQEWVRHATGTASPAEIDSLGIIAAMRLAGHRALANLGTAPAHVLLDGNHDYLTEPGQQDLLAAPPDPKSRPVTDPPVTTLVKGDMTCAGVAAASILAKTTRDEYMTELAGQFPEYQWEINKGYGSAAHRDALRRLGPTPHHRLSWNLGV